MIDAEWHSGRFCAAPQSGTKCHTWNCVPQARCLDRAKGNRGPVRAPGHGWRHVFPGRTRRACHGRGRALGGLSGGVPPVYARRVSGSPRPVLAGRFARAPSVGPMASRRTRRFMSYIKDRECGFGFRNLRSHESGRHGPPPSGRGTLSGDRGPSGSRRLSGSAPDGADGGGPEKKKRNRHTYACVRAAGPVTGRQVVSGYGFRLRNPRSCVMVSVWAGARPRLASRYGAGCRVFAAGSAGYGRVTWL